MRAWVQNITLFFTPPSLWWLYLLVFMVLLAVGILIIRHRNLAKRITEANLRAEPLPHPQLSTQVASALLDLSLETQESHIREALTHSLALFLMSDLCGLLEKTDQAANFRVSQMFDLINESYMQPFTIPMSADPLTTDAIDDGIPLIANGEVKNRAFKLAFQKATGYNAVGNLMVIPLSSDFLAPTIFCLSPYTQREFLEADVERLLPLKRKFIQILSKANTLDERINAAESLQLSLKQLTRNHSQLQEQLISSQRTLEATHLRMTEQKAETTEEVALWVQRQRSLEDEVNELTEKIAENLSAVHEAKEIRRQRDALERALQENKRNLTELNAALSNAQGVIKKVISEPDSPSVSQAVPLTAEGSATTSEDDLSASAPSSFQRRLYDSIQQTAGDYPRREVSLSAHVYAIDTSLDSLEGITLQVVRLMQINAFEASPNLSEVEMSISTQQDGNGLPALEILVTDQGGGLSVAEQTHFLRFARSAGHPAPAGIGNPQALREMIALINQAGGNLWIHSEKDQLTTYRVLLPAACRWAEKNQG